MLYPDFVEILNEAAEMAKKVKAGAVKTAGIASKMAAQMPAILAGSPTSAQVAARDRQFLAYFADYLGGDYKVLYQIVFVYRVLNSISKKSRHILVPERCVY